jgi:predicted Rossmann fold flavoprotein
LKEYDIIVCGAGASGMMAAGIAAQNGAHVLLLEKMKHPARKLRISGKGRCNLTNTARMSDFLLHTGNDSRFLRTVFSQFFSKELISFFNSIGIKTVEERGGRVFPVGQDARQVVDILHKWVLDMGVKLLCENEVKHLIVEETGVKGVRLINKNTFNSGSVIVTTGGLSYPLTGSTGDGYRFAKEAGHHVIPPRPMLVPLLVKEDHVKKLEGLNLKNIAINVWVDGNKCGDAFGEMVFTNDGMSGPIVLSLSRRFIDNIRQKKKVFFSIDLKPALDEQKLDNRILRDINENGKLKFHLLARKWMPGQLLPVFLNLINIPHYKTASQLDAGERKRIRSLLKDFRFEVTRHRSFDEAIITAGGVDLNEIDPQTMGSKKIKKLYFAGEVLDLDADTGGYNLQIAFSTGWVAGKSAALNFIKHSLSNTVV